MTRIIVCHGSAQLLHTVPALRQLGSGKTKKFRDYLVLCGLYVPTEDEPLLASYLEDLAQQMWPWTQILFLPRSWFVELALFCQAHSRKQVFGQVFESLGVKHADELFVAHNWMFESRVLMNAYRDARMTCVGDGFGFYVSHGTKSVAMTNPNAYFFGEGFLPAVEHGSRSDCKGLTLALAKAKSFAKEWTGLKTILGTVDFNRGCFLTPSELFPEPFSLPCQTVSRDTVKTMIDGLAGYRPPEPALGHRVKSGRWSLLLPCNLSEGREITLSNEIDAYREFLSSCATGKDTLCIKPHPRDRAEKGERLRSALSDLFAEIVLLNDPISRFTPVELLTYQLMSQFGVGPARIYSFGTTAISLRYLYDLPSVLGFGTGIVRKYFDPAFVDNRQFYEKLLRNSLSRLIAGSSEAESTHCSTGEKIFSDQPDIL